MANDKAPASIHPAALALAGLLSLAVAMGIGRFAFTPMLPLMIRDGQLDLAHGGWIAAANYAGYLAGALTAARLRIGAAALGLL
ncbi:YbfB/YjiJ family MFS transporter, partial [Ramlibacter sp.]|uniref:YbfB/YjiJ family MFS transporter n=1 Tax=Ramlibacter sp. TaxID=1917967 RepID=UPI0017F4257D